MKTKTIHLKLITTTICALAVNGVQAQSAPCRNTAECAQKAVEAANEAKRIYASIVPSGAVMAFDLESCPSGWDSYGPATGRFILGAGTETNLDQNGVPLTERNLNDTGGAETHLLTVEEMPAHAHQYQKLTVLQPGCGLRQCNGRLEDRPKTTQNAGGGKAHNNMPPFISLLYCKKL